MASAENGSIAHKTNQFDQPSVIFNVMVVKSPLIVIMKNIIYFVHVFFFIIFFYIK